MESNRKITIHLPDNSTMEVSAGVSAGQIAKEISPGLFQNALAAKVNDRLVDLSTIISEDARLEILTYNSPESQEILLHSTSHVMAQAVKQLYPQAKVTIGPAIENRFYYDFDIEPPLTDGDLPAIEARMNEIIAADLPIIRREVSREEAIELFSKMGETYKVEIIREIEPDVPLSIYTQGDFTDLCRGPHIPSTGKIKAFKLLNVAGAYWRGDSRNKMLTRIYGTSFATQKELKKYLNFIEEAKRRDHRKLGKSLELFEINEQVGPGLVLWYPRGALLLQNIKDYWIKEHLKRGYDLVQTPHIGKAQLWETSGHLDFYRESMFDGMTVEGETYYIKPMNCPFHMQIYKSKTRSYRDLPIRYAELGTVYRYELSGVLHGLMRVRGFTQDDAHIICTPEQLNDEIQSLVLFSFEFVRSFGFKEMDVYVATRPKEKYVGSPENWAEATEALKAALSKLDIEYHIDEGGGAFYGPKIDIKIRDALNRSWQCTTIQFDFNEPERFNMDYIASDGNKRRPYMIHRAIMGSLERFAGVLIEHTVGDFPLWIAPVQAVVIPVTNNQDQIATEFYKLLIDNGIRAEINLQNDTIGAKIRDAELMKIPFMFIIGEREATGRQISIRRRKIGDTGVMSWEEAIDLIVKEIQLKKENKS
ncbi:MAG TPA: threonine--tRNA ligase [Candidatus Marinimicrobia bacterium]|nr:threonine--tRNA ligase [Candidatus Neomarinimicrobiota bacterium]HPB00166.1 threonine--tRNA ligase [Candidatus Neomarinimicrobiota bacterium]HPN74469.1 threonine--tRNA ligase [Candidatus Neomarinimicrobiota bacterium]